ncbi:hypothetical protein BC937DRAFT_95683 [Endogone sp. FLAS-F59071]|nr:hypothetical protein BC937DRAFT_95683 [Endogone sp. FLAS-F59071]|eukprot:RUS20219.1 hypothetical protein BC937DRAFT_95683 [Endogone sp. FLAS-F59071]
MAGRHLIQGRHPSSKPHHVAPNPWPAKFSPHNYCGFHSEAHAFIHSPLIWCRLQRRAKIHWFIQPAPVEEPAPVLRDPVLLLLPLRVLGADVLQEHELSSWLQQIIDVTDGSLRVLHGAQDQIAVHDINGAGRIVGENLLDWNVRDFDLGRTKPSGGGSSGDFGMHQFVRLEGDDTGDLGSGKVLEGMTMTRADVEDGATGLREKIGFGSREAGVTMVAKAAPVK